MAKRQSTPAKGQKESISDRDELKDKLRPLLDEIVETILDHLEGRFAGTRAESARSKKKANQRLLTTAEVAQILRVSNRALIGWRTSQKSGGPPFIKAGSAVRYDSKALEIWLSKQTCEY